MNKIELRNYSRKTKDGFYLLKNVSIGLEKGKVTALIGISGEGKTTLMESIVGLCSPNHRTEGGIYINRNGQMLRRRRTENWFYNVNYLQQFSSDYKNMPVGVLLRSIATCFDRPEEKLAELIAKLRMEKTEKTLFRHLSGGEKKRIMLITGFLSKKDVCVWDEPLTGLDTEMARTILTMLRKEKKTYLISVHQLMEDFAKLIDNVAVLCQSTVIYCGSLTDVVAYFTQQGVVFPKETFYLNYITQLCAHNSMCEADTRNIEIFHNLVHMKTTEKTKEQTKINDRMRNTFLVIPRKVKFVRVKEILKRSFYFDKKFIGSSLFFEIFVPFMLVSIMIAFLWFVQIVHPSPSVPEILDRFKNAGVNDELTLKNVKGLLMFVPIMKLCVFVSFILLYSVKTVTNLSDATYYKLCVQNITENQFSVAEYLIANLLECLVRKLVIPFFVMLYFLIFEEYVMYNGYIRESGLGLSGMLGVLVTIFLASCSIFIQSTTVQLWPSDSRIRLTFSFVYSVLTSYLFIFIFFKERIATPFKPLFGGLVKLSNLYVRMFRNEKVREYINKGLLALLRVACMSPVMVIFDFFTNLLTLRKTIPLELNANILTPLNAILSPWWDVTPTDEDVEFDPDFEMAKKETEIANAIKASLLSDGGLRLQAIPQILKTGEPLVLTPWKNLGYFFLISFGIPILLLLAMTIKWYRKVQPSIR